MKLLPVVERLRGKPFVRVEGVMEFARLAERGGALPAAFVVPSRKTASENTLASGAVDQRVVTDFMVLIQLNGGQRAESEISEQLDELEALVIERLLGWSLPGASRPITYAGSEMVGFIPSLITWVVKFRSPYHLRKTN